MMEFLAMNGYGAYIWSSFAITAVAIIIEWGLLKSQNHIILRRLHRQIRLSRK